MLFIGFDFGCALDATDLGRGGAIPARANALRVRAGFFFFLLGREALDLAVTMVGANLVERLVIALDTEDIDTRTRRKNEFSPQAEVKRQSGESRGLLKWS